MTFGFGFFSLFTRRTTIVTMVGSGKTGKASSIFPLFCLFFCFDAYKAIFDAVQCKKKKKKKNVKHTCTFIHEYENKRVKKVRDCTVRRSHVPKMMNARLKSGPWPTRPPGRFRSDSEGFGRSLGTWWGVPRAVTYI